MEFSTYLQKLIKNIVSLDRSVRSTGELTPEPDWSKGDEYRLKEEVKSDQVLLKIEEKFPCTGEQRKIADFVDTLDDKITAEKSKLTAARQFKKALLQRMFV